MRYLTTILLVLAISTAAFAEQKPQPHKKANPQQQKKQQQQQRLQAQQQQIRLRNAQMDLEEREIELDTKRRMAELKIKGMEMKLMSQHKGEFKGPRKGEFKSPHAMKGMRPGGHHKKMICPIFMLVMLVVNILLSVWVYQDIRKRNRGSGLWIAVALLTGLLGTAVYAIVRIGDKEQNV